MIQEETCLDSSNDSQIQVSTVDAFIKPMDQEFSIDQQSLNSVTSSGLSNGYPIGSVNINNSYGYPSNLIQSLFDDNDPQPHNNSLYTNPSISYSSSNEISPTWSNVSSLMKPSMPKQQQQQQLSSGLQFSNNTPFWNASAEALNDIRAGVLASSHPQYQSPNFDQDNKFNSSNALLNKVYNYLFLTI
jgi:hypothetical protein